MAIQTRVAIESQFVPSSVGTLYTPPSGVTRGSIRAATFYANAGATLKVYIIPDGGSASNENQILEEAISANDTFIAEALIGLSIPNGSTLSAEDSSGTSINFTGSVTQFTGDS